MPGMDDQKAREERMKRARSAGLSNGEEKGSKGNAETPKRAKQPKRSRPKRRPNTKPRTTRAAPPPAMNEAEAQAERRRRARAAAPAKPIADDRMDAIHARRAALREKQSRWQQRAPAQPAPARKLDEESSAALEQCQSQFDSLSDDIMLTGVYDEMGQVESLLLSLGSRLEALRGRGFVFRSFMENKIAVLGEKWAVLCDEIDGEIEALSDTLAGEADEAERLLRRAWGGEPAAIRRATSAVASLGSKADASRRAIQSRYRDVAQTVRQSSGQLQEIEWALTEAEDASFDFLHAEFLVAACKAKMLDDPEEDKGPEGILFLTDERLIFEQKEKVAAKKVLFITTESEMVQELLFAEKIGHVREVSATDTRKRLRKKELLSLEFAPDASHRHATFRLLDGADNEGWSRLVGRVRSGEIDRERIAAAEAEKDEASDARAAAPTICPTCGASLDIEVVRGQRSITCDYCSTEIPL